jgi:SAM-dependent methyltransferase
MDEVAPGSDHGGMKDAVWRGVDLSGVTLVLGVGTGQLVALLKQQAALAGGNLVVLSPHMRELSPLVPLQQGPLTLMRGRWRQIPLQSETVDLLVINGVLREVPEERLEQAFEEFWRVLVPGGHFRIADIIEPTEAEYNQAWALRNAIVRKLSRALDRPTALAVNLQRAALALRAVGFEDVAVSLLPGSPLTESWLEDTVNALYTMAGRLADRKLRDEILLQDIKRLIALFGQGGQRAAERFVLRGRKAGDLALDMEASFTEQDLLSP